MGPALDLPTDQERLPRTQQLMLVACAALGGPRRQRRPSPVRTKKNAASIDKDNKCYCSTPTPSPIMHARPTAGAERAMHLSEPAAISSVSATRACGARRRRCVGHQPSLWFCNRSQQAGLVPACMHSSPQRRVCGDQQAAAFFNMNDGFALSWPLQAK
jgi:hypothetical protein